MTHWSAAYRIWLTPCSPCTPKGSEAFRDCTSLSRCVLPTALLTVGESAFLRCTSLAEIALPATLYDIGRYAFFDCHSLSDLTLPAALTTLGDEAFRACGLTELDLSALTYGWHKSLHIHRAEPVPSLLCAPYSACLRWKSPVGR